MPVTKEEYLKSFNNQNDYLFSIDKLKDKSDRTLLYGYTLERDTVHVYVKNNEVYYFCYGLNGDTLCFDLGSFLLVELIPSKRTYPESSDLEFLNILKAQGVSGNFTTYSEKRYENIKDKKYQGEIK